VSDPTRFDLPALSGPGRVRLADFRGKPVVVNMFASWCTVCRAELPAFTAQAHRLAGRVVFVEVNSEETGSGTAMAVEFHLAQAGMILARDLGPPPASAMHDALGAQGMPVTAFYDATGNLVDRSLGALVGSDLGSKLHDLYGV
jgi:thiol-disulfide isomerase/thioredoxin